MGLVNVEDAKTVEVGRQYLVNMVKGDERFGRLWNQKWIPVLGRAHEDESLTGSPDQHYHVDWRFVGVDQWAWMVNYLSKRQFANAHIGYTIWEREVLCSPIRKRRACRRLHATFPHNPHWMPRLEAEYANKKSDCRTCPHRGISLVGAPVVDGALVCAGHGLAWDVETGALKPRTKEAV